MTSIVCNPIPLESGDRLTRDEFHRRYLQRPDIKKAELVDGVVYVASPVRFSQHGEPHNLVSGWLFSYRVLHPSVRIGSDATVRLDDENEFQPDALLFRAERTEALGSDDYVYGPPDLVFEVAASSASYDLHDKKAAYERNGVGEYVVWDIERAKVFWFVLDDARFVEISPDADGVFESRHFPGLRLDSTALLEGDPRRLVAALR